tara:strand:+ start:104 stop:1087 length:984 start_codon:yes stop_codon:yes gene_type:complete
MITLIKDLLNPINWVKLILNPSKFEDVLNRIFYYPGLNFKSIKSKSLKTKFIKFLITMAKKNNSFRDFFFQNVEGKSIKYDDNIVYNFSNIKNNLFYNNEFFEKLKKNGIVIIENALDQEEHKLIKKLFEELSSNASFGKTVQGSKSKDILIKVHNKNLDSEMQLLNISNTITKKIYGKIVKPKANYIYSKAINIPESIFPGDNNMHFDRFLPNIKLIYFPENVDLDSAPFRYALGSHKIDENYLDFFINNDDEFFDERSNKVEIFKKNPERKFEVNENTLVIALTNGFHGRSPFNKITNRKSLFLTYPNFNLLSLMNYRKFNLLSS